MYFRQDMPMWSDGSGSNADSHPENNHSAEDDHCDDLKHRHGLLHHAHDPGHHDHEPERMHYVPAPAPFFLSDEPDAHPR